MANMAPILAARMLPSWDYPMDMHLSVNGTRLFGEHKTMRGLVAGMVFGYLTLLYFRYAQSAYPGFAAVSPYDFSIVSPTLGILIAIGALGGDAVKSLFKRQLRIPPGSSWMPFDQVDWIVGALLVTYPFVRLSAAQIAVSFGLGFLFHIASRFVGFLLRFNTKPI